MLPSIKTLRLVFGDNAEEARRVLEMTRAELIDTYDVARRRVLECYNPPDTYDVRLTVLDTLAGTFGVEAFQTDDGEWCDYLNNGETYATTLIYWRGRYRVGDWGSIAERYLVAE